MRLVLYGIFGLSGAAGLIYESIWARYLSLFVGHSAYAQVLVLIIFLGGMALGAMLVARWTARLGDPLLWYAAAELALALFALGFHEIQAAITESAYATVFPHVAGTPLLTVVKWGTAGALILPQSVLLGTTFPLMVAGSGPMSWRTRCFRRSDGGTHGYRSTTIWTARSSRTSWSVTPRARSASTGR